MRKAAAVVTFFGAWAIGAGAAYVVNGTAEEPVADVRVSYKLIAPVEDAMPVYAFDLLGRWSGTWGYGRERCTIDIDRIDGVKFYGTLRKDGAVVTLEGYIDPEQRHVHFKETKVVKLGPEMSEWSLGLNAGDFSPDGRTLSGEGTDEWGSYRWNVTRDR
jgi:hypothetical protein